MFRRLTKDGLKLGAALGLTFMFVFALQAVSPAKASAAYNGANLIDNATFLDATSMTPSQIQSFLVGKNSGLANLSFNLNCAAAGAQGAQWYAAVGAPCGQNVAASSIIYYAAQVYGVSPKVIMTTMQKEQSLITAPSPTSWQLNQAMGYACPDSGNCSASSSFFYQVDNGTWALRFHYERANGNNSWWYNTTSWVCGVPKNYYKPNLFPGGPVQFFDDNGANYTTITLANAATSAFYCYTPHAYNNPQGLYGLPKTNTVGMYYSGSYNFVSYYESWFGPTVGTFLLQSPQSPAVYLLSGSTRYGIPSWDVLKAYGFGNIKVTPVSDLYINSLTDGGTLGTTFTQDGQGAIYLADNGYRFGFSTYAQCVNWGFPNCLSNSKPLEPYLFNQILNAGDMKSLMLNSSGVFLMDNGQKRQFFTSNAITQSGYSNNDIIPITNTANMFQPMGFSIPENNSFVSFGATPVIYIYHNGLFYPINSYDTFRSILPSNTPVYSDTTSLYNSQLPAVQKSVTSTLSMQSGAKTYLFSNGNKYDISSTASNWPVAQAFDELNNIISSKATTATTDVNSTFQTPEGYIFRVINKTVLPFYSLADFFSSSYTKQPLTVSDSAIAGLSTGNPLITPGGGSLFKVSTAGRQNLIFSLNTDGTSCNLASLSQLGDFQFITSNVSQVSESMAAGPILTGLVKTGGGAYYIVSGGTKTPVSSSSFSNWGMTSSVCSLSDSFLNRLPTTQSAKTMLFARIPSGLIYYENGGAAHQILTYSSFLSLGGNSNNTVNVSSDFLSYVTAGAPIN